MGACATASSEDDIGELVEHSESTMPEGESDSETRLPPASTPSANTKSSEVPESTKEEPEAPSNDTPPPPPPPSNPAPGAGECDSGNMLYMIKLLASPSPAACPCNAGQCCVVSGGAPLGCVDE